MDFLKAVNIIERDLDEAMALLEQLNGISGPELAEIKLARSRVQSASDLLKLLPGMTPVKAAVAGAVTNDSMPAMEPADVKVSEDSAAVQEQATQPAPEPLSEPANVIKPVQEPEPVRDTKAVHVPEPVTGPKEAYHLEPAAETAPQSDYAPAPTAVSSHSHQPAPTAEPVKQPAAAQKNHEPSKPILADRFSQSGTLGDRISPVRQDEAITTAMHSKPIADIGAAIGINDRFRYIRELFSGDTLAYNDTIRRLNNSASLGEAMRILDESTVMGSDPATQSSFVDVVRRKFSLNV